MKASSAAPVFFALAALAAGPALAQASSPDGGAPPAPASDPVLDALAKAKAQSEAKKAAADAEKAALESEKARIEAAAALKTAKNGTVVGPETKIDGAATVGTDGLKAEGLLLSSAAAQSAGRMIRDDLATVYAVDGYKTRSLVIVTSVDQLTTTSLTAYEVQRGYLATQLDKAQRRFRQIQAQAPLDKLLALGKEPETAQRGARSLLGAMAAGSEVLSAASKIAAYFKTDYSFGNLTIETAPDLYADALVQALRREPLPGNPAVYATTYQTIGETDALSAEIGALHVAAAEVAYEHDLAVAAAAALRGLDLTDPKDAFRVREAAIKYETFAAAVASLPEAANSLITALFTGAADKPAPIVRIAQEREVRSRLKADSLALLVSGKPTAAYYTTKSLWSGIFGAPVHVMGGANVDYSLFDPKTGQVVTRGVAPVHGGYHNVRDVQKQFSAR